MQNGNMNRSKQRKRQEEGAGPEAGVPGRAQEAGAGGKRWVGKRVRLGKGGRAAGKWTGFSHVFPHVSTQVVDFQRLAMVRHFLDANFANERELGKEFGQGGKRANGGGNQD